MRTSSVNLGKDARKRDVDLPYTFRRTHMQVLGVSQKGKSTFLEHLIRQDIKNRQGLCLIDPHGSLYDDVLKWLVTYKYDKRRTIHLLDAGHLDYSFGFNPLRIAPNVEPIVQIDSVLAAIGQVFGGQDVESMPLLSMVLQLVLYTLATRNLTFFEAPQITSPHDAEGLRKYLTTDVGDLFFQQPWDALNSIKNDRLQFEQFQMAYRRFFRFLAAEHLRYIFGQQEGIDLRQCMDEGHIVLVNLGRANRLSEMNRNLLGSLLVDGFVTTSLGREAFKSRPFYLYMDECDRYLNSNISRILDQTAKFGLHLVMSHQRLGHLRKAGEDIYNAVMNGAQTKAVFALNDEEDLRAIAGSVFMGELNLERPKHALDKAGPTGEYLDLWLRSQADADTHGESWSRATGTSATDIHFLNDPESDAAIPIGSSGSSSSGSTGGMSAHTHSEGHHQAREMQYEEQVTQVYSLEEERYRTMVEIHNQGVGEFTLKLPKGKSRAVYVPKPVTGHARRTRVDAAALELLATDAFIRSLPTVKEELETRHSWLLDQVKESTAVPEPATTEFAGDADWIDKLDK